MLYMCFQLTFLHLTLDNLKVTVNVRHITTVKETEQESANSYGI